MDRLDKLLFGSVFGTVAFAAVHLASIGLRDSVRPPENYHGIEAQEIQDYDGLPVELSMNPVYVGREDGIVALSEGKTFLRAKPFWVERGGNLLFPRPGMSWDLDTKAAAFDSIENLVLSGEQTPITVRGVLKGDTLRTYSITTNDKTYSIMDRRDKE
ncbi:hypothetical protein HOF78_00205 [Candidatus Woesearchaeota archaeon]|jgi:hypothetical protein|nr:hypothetical protein [Candidatus Woesearchaeota archaeon]